MTAARWVVVGSSLAGAVAAVVVGWVVFLQSATKAPAPEIAAPVLQVFEAPCPFAVPEGRTVRCGSIAVPETWQHPDYRPVTLFYAITPATGGAAAADPVLVLNGGPGQAATDLIGPSWDGMAELRAHRDIIFVDQRGTGYSLPGLFCPTLDPLAFWHGGMTPDDARTCRQPLADKGFDLANFNTEESARDLVGVRRAFGIASWNLLGTSYGTILAMEVVRIDQAGVRSVVLNSPNLTRASWLDFGRMSAIADVYKHLFEACRADAACDRAYPRLEQVFADLAKKLTAKPLPVTFTNPRTGSVQTAEMSFRGLLNVLTVLVGSGRSAAQVPAILWHLHQVVNGEADPDMRLLGWLYMPYWGIMDSLAYGLNAAIGCREVRPWVDADSARASAALFYPYVVPSSIERDYDVFCPIWKLPPGPEVLRQPVRSDVPVLILTGVYDTLTPTTLADTVAKTLTHARVLRFDGIGHDVYAASACARDAAARFVGTPQAALDLPCLSESTPLPFIIRPAARSPGHAAAPAP